MKAIWNDTVIAESEATIVIEGNHYFPPDSVSRQFLRDSERTSTCPWKGNANYYDIVVGDAVNSGAAWYYKAPKEAASEIKDHVAFWNGVEVKE